MNLREKIQEDIKGAMISKDQDKLSTIRMLKSAIQYFEIQKGGAGYEATDEDVIDVVSKEIKKRKESIELYEKGGRQELADKEKFEITILQGYMPQQLSDEEINSFINDAIIQTGASTIQDMGKVMGVLSPKIKGKADGGTVSRIVRERLGS